MGVVFGAGRVAKHIRQQARDRVDQDQRRELTARQNVVADRDLIRDQMRANAFVHTLVAAAEQGDPFVARQLLGHALREDASLRCQQDNGDNDWLSPFGNRSQDGFDRFENGLGFHHHPASASIRSVVCGVMFVVRIITNIMDAHFEQSPLAGALKNTGL
jgi:hypothetical protein